MTTSVDALLTKIADGLRQLRLDDPLMIGIQTGGVWVAQQLMSGWGGCGNDDGSSTKPFA